MNIDEYERLNRMNYERLSTAVEHILRAALDGYPLLRLHILSSRAKTVDSLRKKLINRGIVDTESIESQIKDLAGVRLVFYTNSDVTLFENSAIIHDSFEIESVNIHHPKSDAQEASGLFISNNYCVKIKPERLALPDYTHFADLRCEIQVQTMLNHAWAEMAHDTIYKKPNLNGVGSKAMEAIEARMARVMRDHLLPAGHDFDKIARDFGRLIAGQQILADEPIDAIINAPNNNERFDATERLIAQVLALYSGEEMAVEFAALIPKLVEAIKLAREEAVQPIDTPFGNYPGKTARDIAAQIGEFLEANRYIDLELVFDTVLALYVSASDQAERDVWQNVGDKLASHELTVWQEYGPAAQKAIIDRFDQLDHAARGNARDLLISMLGHVLSPEVSGTTWRADAVVLHHGAVIPSPALRDVRSRAIGALAVYLEEATTDVDRRRILRALQNASQTPMRGRFDLDLSKIILADAAQLTAIERLHAGKWGLELQRFTEESALRRHWCHRALPAGLNDEDLNTLHVNLLSELLALRDDLNATAEFILYKTFVGYDSVFPNAWDSDPFDHEARDAWRQEAYSAIVAEITVENTPLWIQRLRGYLVEGEPDGATFTALGDFLGVLSEIKPEVAIRWFELMDDSLARFIVPIAHSLSKAGYHEHVSRRMLLWVEAGRYLDSIVWYLRAPETYDEVLLRRVSEQAIASNHQNALIETINLVSRNYKDHPGNLIDSILMPIMGHFLDTKFVKWVHFSWCLRPQSTLLAALDKAQAQVVLETFIALDEIEYHAEQLLTGIASRFPELVITFFDNRLRRKIEDRDASANFSPVPFSFYALHEPLGQHPEALLSTARRWHDAEPVLYQFRGGRLILNAFPAFPDTLDNHLRAIVSTGKKDDIKFVLANLPNFEGSTRIYPICMEVVDRLEDGDDLFRLVSHALEATGVMRGEFGMVAEYQNQKSLISEWLDDARPKVQAFAAKRSRNLDQRIAWEQRRAEQDIEARRRDYGDDQENVV